jgi:hypothetical protein
MNDAKSRPLPDPPVEEAPAVASPVSERCRELAELEAEIRRRLRSNQRFLERFLDEDFVDDEGADNDEAGADGEEL